MSQVVEIPSRGVRVEFPDEATPEQIQKALEEHYPRTGADVAFDLQDPKFGSKISLDDYKLYRGFLAENKKSVGEMVSEGASMVLGDLWEGVKAQAKDQAKNPITGPLRTAHDMAVAFGVGTHDLLDMGIRGFEKPYANDTYEEFLKGDISWTNPQQNLRRGMRWLQTGKMSRKDSPKARETYEKLLKKDLENFRDQSDREAFRARLLSKAFVEKRAHAGSMVLDPSIIVPIPGTKALTTAARVGAKATGKAVERTGRALARTGAAVSGTADDLATAGGKAFESTVGMTPDMAQTTARAVGVGVPVASGLGTPLAVGYGLTKAAQYGGEVLAEAGQGMQRGLGRGGLFGSAAHRMELAGLADTPQARAARLLSLADTPLEAAAHVSGGALTGALIGGGLGMWAGGEEGFWHGLGAGGALGAGGGGIGYGIGKATGALSAEARKADNDYRLSQLPEADRARLESYRKWQGDDQLAVILDTKDFLEGGLKDGRVIFYANPDGPRGSALSIADTDSGGMPAIKINLAKMDGAYTVGHELFHALSKVEQLQPEFQPIMDAIGGRYDDTGTRLLQEGIIPQAALETFFNDYHRKELPLIRSKILAEAEARGLTEGTKEHGDHVVTELAREEGKFNTAGKRAKYVAEEIGAEYMARLIAGAGPDAMLKGFDTHLRGKLDSILIQRSEGILSSLTQRFSDLGISPVESQLFPGLEKANPVLNAMMRDLLRARRKLNERMEGTDTKSTSVIRKQDFKHHADELSRMGLAEQDATGKWVRRDTKDLNREEEAFDLAMTEILSKDDPNGFQFRDVYDDNGKLIKQKIVGSRFSPDQLQAINEHGAILPVIQKAINQVNAAKDEGKLWVGNYFAATTRRKNARTGKSRSVYSSRIRRTTRSLQPYTLERSDHGNWFTKALDWHKAQDEAVKLASRGGLDPWHGSPTVFLADFQLYLANLGLAAPRHTREVFGDAKAEILHQFLQEGEDGGSKFVRTFRLDRMDGGVLMDNGVTMSEQVWSRSKERFMPDDATVRQVVSGRMEHGTPLPAAVVLTPNIIERFLPAVDDPGYHSPEGKIGFPILADRMKVGGYTSRSGRTHELRGGPDHPDIVDNKGVVAWAVEGGPVATRLQNAINKTDGIGLVVLQDEAAVAGNKTFMEIMLDELAFDVATRKKTAVNSQIKKAVKEMKKVPNSDGSQKHTVLNDVNIRNLDELAAAAPGFSFELRRGLFTKIASDQYRRKHGGIYWKDVVRDVTDYQNRDGYRSGDIVKVIQFDQGESIVNPKDVGTPPHPAYKFAVLGHTVSNVKGRLSAFQVFRSAFDAMEAEKSGRGITPEGKVGKSAFRSMMTRWDTPIFRQDVSGRALDVAARDEPLEFQAKSGPQRAELAQRSEINRELGARHMPDAWHGSPRRFDRFDSARIGEGEGYQAFGHGLYFSSKRAVAEHYRDTLPDKDNRGHLYEVELAPKDHELLDWDKPLSEQSEFVRSKLNDEFANSVERKSGEEMYKSLGWADGHAHASAELKEMGIRGIRYLDAGSRADGEGSYNYVIFDEADVTIRSRYLPDTGGQDALGMFSAAERAAVGLKQERGSASQMLSMIKKAGVKDEEIVELGLDKFLEGNRKVSKDEIVDHLVENQIVVEETVLAESGLPLLRAIESNNPEPFATMRAAGYEPDVSPTGGQLGFVRGDGDIIDFMEIGNEGLPWEVAHAANVIADNFHSPIGERAKHASYVEPGAVEGSYRELLLRLPEFEKSFRTAEEIATNRANPTDYTGGHYGEHPNVLAHIRFNERTGPNGERVLFLEEIQSDWHQGGRKRGYLVRHRFDMDFSRWTAERDPRSRTTGDWTVRDGNGEIVARGFEGDTAQDAISDAAQLASAETTGVPDAPFKTSWHELAMKRMIRYAADNGFDSIAWTKGDTQFKRYGSQEIAWVRDGDGWKVKGTEQRGGGAGGIDIEGAARAEGILREGGRRVTRKEDLRGLVLDIMSREQGDWTPEFYESHVSKLTDRIWERMQNEDAGTSLPRKEGMGGFYDRMLPRMKTWKKLGLKVEEGSFDTGDFKVMKRDFQGGPYYRLENRNSPDAVSIHPTAEAAWAAAEALGATPAHIVHLTPEVKAKVLESGLARFMPDTGLPGTERNQLGWAMLRGKNGKWKVYKPGGVLAGIGGSKQRAETIFRTHYKRELKRQTR